MRYYKIFSIMNALCMLVLVGCKKQDDFLDVKRNLSDVRPSTIKDFQAILDDATFMNYQLPSIGFAGSDNSYLSDANMGIFDPPFIGAYLWKRGNFYAGTGTSQSADWDLCYSTIEHANIVLDGLGKLNADPAAQTQFNQVKGSALFFRSLICYCLAQIYCKPYDKSSSASDLGIVLRLTSDVNQKSTRGTVQETYDRIISDLKEAIPLLPLNPEFSTRPGQPAANALLAKVYLSMADYPNAALYSNNALSQFNTLLDYNTVTLMPGGANSFAPFPNNPEVCFHAIASGEGSIFAFPGLYIVNVDTLLYNLYDSNDLRKSLYYTVKSSGNVYLTGGYGQDKDQSYAFSGIATNEMLLIRSESYARTGNIPDALADLNLLLSNRYKSGTFTPLTASDPDQLLDKILLERRKELPFTGQLRWEDLRRLNKDPQYAITLTRHNNGQTYTLPPNDPRYVLPIPDSEIQLSGIQQNER